jgi:hypothetical protein
MTSLQETFRIMLIGCGATLVLDVWLILLKRLGVPIQSFAYIGRWVGHMFHGRFQHVSISKALPVSNELLLGCIVHYGIGMAFAGLLVALFGTSWTANPAWAPALLVGIGTVVAPFFVMQPAMGSGIAGSRTPAPWISRIRSVMNHAVFGLGLYLTARIITWVLP